MSETRLRTSMPGVAAPTGAPRRPNYDVLIGQRASNREWWHPDPGYAIEGSTPGQLGTLLSQKASGGTALIQASAANQPLIIANALDGRPALRFMRSSSGAPRRLNIPSFPAGAGQSWSFVALIKSAARQDLGSGSLGGGDGVLSTTGTSDSLRLDLSYITNDGEIAYLRGGSGLPLEVKKARPVDEWFVLWASWNGADKSGALRVNDSTWSIDTSGNVDLTAPSAWIGAFSGAGTNQGTNMDVAMMGVDTIPLHVSSGGGGDALLAWKQLIRDDFPSMRSKIAA